MNTLSLSDSIGQKMKSGSFKLTSEEREYLEKQMIDNFIELVTRIDDERLMQMTNEYGMYT